MDPPSENPAYLEALRYLYGRIDYERSTAPPPLRCLKLERMTALLEGLDNPQQRLAVVHVAGTKGKGSVSSMIAAILAAARYRTGLYTSPHLDRLPQRIVLDGEPCREEELVELTDRVRGVVASLDEQYLDRGWTSGPTFFEITTAMAMLHFALRGVDVAVLEVGLGGRLDSTNVCQPLVSIITSISFDHTRQLGNSLEAIAREKAGIVKPGIPAVTGVTAEGPLEVIREVCRRQGAPLWEFQRDFACEYHRASEASPGWNDLPAARFSYREPPTNPTFQLEQVPLGLAGSHQAINAAVSVAAIRQLQQQGWRISSDAVRQGIGHVRCPARFELVAQQPAVIVDVAHNVASVAALADTLEEYFPRARRTLVFAASKDKDCAGMLNRLLPHCAHLVLTRFQNNPRAMEAEVLASLARTLAEQAALSPPPRIDSVPDPISAYEMARAGCGPQEVICITGSFYLVAELRRHVLGNPQPAGALVP